MSKGYKIAPEDNMPQETMVKRSESRLPRTNWRAKAKALRAKCACGEVGVGGWHGSGDYGEPNYTEVSRATAHGAFQYHRYESCSLPEVRTVTRAV